MAESKSKPEPVSLAVQAEVFEALFAGYYRAADLHKSMTENGASQFRAASQAVLTVQRDVAQMSLEAVSSADPTAIVFLLPRAIELGLREATVYLTGSIERSASIGLSILSTSSDPEKGKVQRS